MRWFDLFADLEAQLAQADHAELIGQVADRTRRERAAVSWVDRAASQVGRLLMLTTTGGHVRGTLQDLGSDWLLIDEVGRGSAFVPVTAVMSLTGLSSRSDGDRGYGRRFGMGVAMRAIARDRCVVAVQDLGGGVVIGTIDAVGSDHLEIAEHPADSLRRSTAVTGYRTVPFRAICVVRRQ